MKLQYGDSGGHNANIGGHNAKCHYGTSASVVLGSRPEVAEQRILLPHFQGINHTGITLPKARTEEFKVVNSRSEKDKGGVAASRLYFRPAPLESFIFSHFPFITCL